MQSLRGFSRKWSMSRNSKIKRISPCLNVEQQRRCTDVFIMTKDKNPVHARTMEFGKVGNIMSVTPPGNSFDTLSPFDGTPGITGANKFGYFSMNVTLEMNEKVVFQTNCDGVNEKGLSIGALYMPGYAGFQEVRSKEDAPRAVSNLRLTDYLLGNFENVEEVRDKVVDLICWDMVSSESKGKKIQEALKLGDGVPSAAFHWVVYDKGGDGVVIEYVNGELTLHESIGVFTNSPSYDWNVTNATMYDGLTATNPEGIYWGGGYGLTGAPGDWSGPSRFVRAYLQRKFMKEAENCDEAVNRLSHIINTVDLVDGINVGNIPGLSDITNWSVIKDMSRNKMFFRVYDGLNWGCVDMDFPKLTQLSGQPAWQVDLPAHSADVLNVFSSPKSKKL